MPATMWKGVIGFGLVSIPIELQAATGDHDIHFHQLHVKDVCRIRQKRICEIDGAEVPYSDIAKGYEEGGKQAALTDVVDLLAALQASMHATEKPKPARKKTTAKKAAQRKRKTG